MSQHPGTAPDPRYWAAPATRTPAAINWPAEAAVAVVASALSAIAGAGVGLIWPRVAPHIDAVNAALGAVSADKALLGDDVWFGFLGVLAAIVCVALLLLVSGPLGRGPGAVLGVAAGGVLGSLVAAHIGTVVQQPHLVSSVQSHLPPLRPRDVPVVIHVFTFKLRAREMLLAWPITAVLLVALNVLIRSLTSRD